MIVLHEMNTFTELSQVYSAIPDTFLTLPFIQGKFDHRHDLIKNKIQ